MEQQLSAISTNISIRAVREISDTHRPIWIRTNPFIGYIFKTVQTPCLQEYCKSSSEYLLGRRRKKAEGVRKRAKRSRVRDIEDRATDLEGTKATEGDVCGKV